MPGKSINEASVTELKAAAYEVVCNLERLQQQRMILEAEINRRQQEQERPAKQANAVPEKPAPEIDCEITNDAGERLT